MVRVLSLLLDVITVPTQVGYSVLPLVNLLYLGEISVPGHSNKTASSEVFYQ